MRVAVKNMIFTPVMGMLAAFLCKQDTMEIFIKESDEIMYRNKEIK